MEEKTKVMGLPKMSMSIEKKEANSEYAYMRRSALLQRGVQRAKRGRLLKTIFIQVYFILAYIYMSMLIRYVLHGNIWRLESGINFP